MHWPKWCGKMHAKHQRCYNPLPLKESRPEILVRKGFMWKIVRRIIWDTLVRCKEFRIFGLQERFWFPGCFVFHMITPLNFIKLYSPSSSNSLLLIQNLNRMLLIGKIRLYLDFFHFYLFSWYSEAFLELRHMKHIVYGCKVNGKFQTICKGLRMICRTSDQICSHGSL